MGQLAQSIGWNIIVLIRKREIHKDKDSLRIFTMTYTFDNFSENVKLFFFIHFFIYVFLILSYSRYVVLKVSFMAFRRISCNQKHVEGFFTRSLSDSLLLF